MPFQLPQIPDRSETIRRFVQTSLQNRAQIQNESLAMQKELVDMEARQKRQEAVKTAYQGSLQRMKAAYSKPTPEFNQHVESEASQWDMADPAIARTIRAMKGPEPKLMMQKGLDEKGQSIETPVLYDERLKKFDPVPNAPARVTDKNERTIQGTTDVGDVRKEEAITLDAKGKVVGRTQIGEKAVPGSDRGDRKATFPEETSAYKTYEQRKMKEAEVARVRGQELVDIGAAIQEDTDPSEKTGYKTGSIIYKDKLYKIGKQTDELRAQIQTGVDEANKNVEKYQGLLEKVKAAYTKGLNVDDAAVIKQVEQEQTDDEKATIAERNNNPWNIMHFGQKHLTPGTDKTKDGKIVKFESVDQATQEAVKLLRDSTIYKGKTVNEALMKWSNGGYNATMIAPDLTNKIVSDLSDDEMKVLLTAMAKQEGYRGPLEIKISGKAPAVEEKKDTAALLKKVTGLKRYNPETKKLEDM